MWTAFTTWGACRASAPWRPSPTSPSSTTSGRGACSGSRAGPSAPAGSTPRCSGTRSSEWTRGTTSRSGYYEHWLTAVATLLVEGGFLTRDELDARAGPFPLSRPATVTAADVDGGPPVSVPRFDVGDAVRVRDVGSPRSHARAPATCAAAGVASSRSTPVAPSPELEAHGGEKVAEAVYAVRFESTELWGDEASEHSCVHVDSTSSYLDPHETCDGRRAPPPRRAEPRRAPGAGARGAARREGAGDPRVHRHGRRHDSRTTSAR